MLLIFEFHFRKTILLTSLNQYVWYIQQHEKLKVLNFIEVNISTAFHQIKNLIHVYCCWPVAVTIAPDYTRTFRQES